MEVTLKNWFMGLGKSSRDENKFDEIVGLDIHSEPGLLKASRAMVKESGTTITELCKTVALDEQGNSYWFSTTSGKVYRRTATGTWSLFHTLSSMTTGILGACYYHGQIFFATGAKLGRYNIATDTWFENIETFTRQDNKYKPMVEQNLTLYIGDQDYIASISYNTSTGNFDFNANALDVKYNQRCSALAALKGNLMIGTASRTTENKSWIFFWDTYSDSWTYEDYIPEPYVNTIIPADNVIYIQAGQWGNIYACDGVTAVRDKVLRREETDNNTLAGYGGHHSATEFNGKAIFVGFTGIWSIANYDNELPRAVATEYVLSPGQNCYIGAAIATGSSLLISWQYGATYGVDNISSTAYYNGFITTPAIEGDFQGVEVKYAVLPSNCSIEIQTNINDNGFVTQTPIVDTNRRTVYFDGGLGDTTTLQAKITLTTYGNTTPKIESIKFL